MICELSIRNFAIIDDLHITFSNGLTILSGETGAGKSIIIHAVNLLLGSRATSRMVRTGSDTAELEAGFDLSKESRIAGIMKEAGFDPSEGLIIRRIISRNDRHRIYINGRLATIQILSSITENLASISGQHAHQGLLKEDQHLLILDQFGGLIKEREMMFRFFHKTIPLIKKLDQLYTRKSRQREKLELLEFQKKEIEEICVLPDEDALLEQEKRRLKNSETLYRSVQGVVEMLYDGQGSLIEKITEIAKTLEKAGEIDPALSSKSEGILELSYRVEDVTEELRNYADQITTDGKRLEDVENRIDLINRLKRKYGGSIESVAEHFEMICRELEDVENLADRISETEAELDDLHEKMTKLADSLSMKRKHTAQVLAVKVEQELSDLKMPQTEFEVFLDYLPASPETSKYLSHNGRLLSENGFDRARFLISPNIGESMKPLADIASGGELSRVVLALKAILVETDSVETVVFDEVDSGIGGSAAEVVGKKLASLSRFHQVICITHLAQIAKFGDHHYKISKEISKGRTKTIVEPLENKKRLEEIARMLGGEKITRATRNHAEEMLNQQSGKT
ncbi:MAG: DNA repair protein RecN [Desulfobacterales bacterium]